jgi:hypothetical protein
MLCAMKISRNLAVICVLAAVPGWGAGRASGQAKDGKPLRFEVTLADSVVKGEALTGHLILCIAKPESGDGAQKPQRRGRDTSEPRFQIDEGYQTQQAFGVDVEGLRAGGTIVVDDASFGYPLRSLAELPAGDYVVQAVFNKYEEFHPGGGKAVWLPPDEGEGQHWNSKPGNPMSAPVTMHLDGKSGGVVRVVMDKVVGPVAAAEADTQQLKHIKIRSAKLSQFWGRDISIGAMVLLPAGWAEHKEAHYPVVVWEDHFQNRFRAPASWRETPPDPNATGYEKIGQVWAYRFHEDWMNGVLPHVILVVLNHANPYYDDSYAVNSANLGPYGDAITEEVIPEIEKRYRGIGQGWARGTEGGSTGGWEALAAQIFYPDYYNGAWGMCPDPVDFHAYQVTDLYEDKNAYVRSGPFESVQIPSDREGDGDVTAEMAQVNHYEYVLGTKGRSGEQYDIWQAVFSPVGADGYPRPIYDKVTGAVDAETAKYWREHYDLDAIMMRDWPTLGPKLEGKLHVAVGLSDTFYLNNAVHLMQKNLEKTQNPHSDATFDYGAWAPHCFTGTLPDWDESYGLDFQQRVLPLMVKHMLATAPKGADVTSWRY